MCSAFTSLIGTDLDEDMSLKYTSLEKGGMVLYHNLLLYKKCVLYFFVYNKKLSIYLRLTIS